VVNEYFCGECGNSFSSDAAVKEHRRFAHSRRIEQIDHDDGGTAFGMNLRDYFAANAMQAFTGNMMMNDKVTPKHLQAKALLDALPDIAEVSFALADAMLRARKA
jgi:hypothetical protein